MKIGGTLIEQIGKEMPEQAVKFLGIPIDEHLTWNAHIKHISKSLFSISQLKNCLPKITMIRLYNALIQPYQNYGIQICGNSRPTCLQTLQRIQKKAIRMIHGATYNSHTAPLLKNAHILEIPDLCKFQVLIFIRDYNALSQAFSNLFLQNLNIDIIHKT